VVGLKRKEKRERKGEQEGKKIEGWSKPVSRLNSCFEHQHDPSILLGVENESEGFEATSCESENLGGASTQPTQRAVSKIRHSGLQ
jgi:hypothetical protein